MISAHVTADDLTMIVRHDDIQTAVDHLVPRFVEPGFRVELAIEYREMTEEEFAAIPELQ